MNADGTETITTKDASGQTISVITVGQPDTNSAASSSNAPAGSRLNVKA
jgi:hypothetical protein